MKPVKVSDNVLRWSLVFLAVATVAVSAYVTADSLLKLGEDGLDDELEGMYTTMAGLFIFIGILALIAVWPACKSSKSAIITTLVFTVITVITAVAATLVYLARHLQYKRGLVVQCAIQLEEPVLFSGREAICTKQWQKAIGYKAAYAVISILLSGLAIELAWLRLSRVRRAAKATPVAPAADSTPTPSVHNDAEDEDDDIELAQPAVVQPMPSGEDYSEKPAPPKYTETAPAYSRVL